MALERQLFERQRERLAAAYREAGGPAVEGFGRVMRAIMDPAARAYLDRSRGGVSHSAAHILVVDDDDRLRRLLQRYLGENGFRVTTADNAGDARAKMRSVQPDLLVLDVTMPGETGLDLTEAMRRDRSDMPILLLTARGAPGGPYRRLRGGGGRLSRQAV